MYGCRMSQAKSMQRATQLQVRVSAAEKVAFQEAATITGLSVSDWVRQLARKAAIGELRTAGREKLAEALTR